MAENEGDDVRRSGPEEKRVEGKASSSGSKRHLPRGIVIQLTGTEGEWDNLDDSELIFSLDHHEDYPPIPFSKERHLSVEDDSRLHSQSFHVPLSPSSPGSLANCSASNPGFLSPGPSSPTHRPFVSLVKSLSTELELKEGSTLRPKPFLNLVKSISTEISRSEPEVSSSKSDSRLNLHLWKQLTQSKGRSNGDSRTAPPSPGSLSPNGEPLRGGFFKLELEDTRRKLSEAVQEPLSNMFSKIMREESGGSPKHQSKIQAFHQLSCRSLAQEGSMDTVFSESPVRNSTKSEAEVFNWPPVRRFHHSSCPLYQHRHDQTSHELEISTDGDVLQVTSRGSHQAMSGPPTEPQVSALKKRPPSPHPVPHSSLFCVGIISYIYLILPLSSYLSGMALGLGLGFLLGLLLISVGSCKSRSLPPEFRLEQSLLGEKIQTNSILSPESELLKGWMNEVQDYDPDTHHPSQTHSVFATLEGSCLRLDSPRNNISRRATCDERIPEATFVHSRFFQLTQSKVFLLPPVLARKRTWNPKYPICLQLAPTGGSQDHEGDILKDSVDEEPDATHTTPIQGSCDPINKFPTTLFLFGRTGREKEEWFRHFLFASSGKQREKEAETERPDRCGSRSGDPGPGSIFNDEFIRVGSSDDDALSSTPPAPSVPAAPPTQPCSSPRNPSLLDYHCYMTRLLATVETSSPLSTPEGGSSAVTSPTVKETTCTCDLLEHPGKSQMAWADALIGRIFWDFLREKAWADGVSQKIQKKLNKIRLPYFMNDLTLTELDMGNSMPHITAASKPVLNHRGLWVELQLVYTGALQMTLETKFNLSRLGKEESQETESGSKTHNLSSSRTVLSVLADSDEESSSAGSSDEEELLPTEPQTSVGEKGLTGTTESGGRTGRKILKFMDKITKSKYFQKATENEFIRKKFEEMSNTPLLLAVEVHELSGPLVINIPPPPTDRIWYSFCVPPKLDLHVRPKLGEREVTFCHITEWIEKKLQDEFQKVFVLPNMDDIYLPLMHSGISVDSAESVEEIHRTESEEE